MTESMHVADLMTREPRTLRRNEELLVADELMREGGLRHLPVLDENGDLCGIVSQRDIYRSTLLRALGFGEWAETKVLKSVLVKEVMHEQPVTISADASVAEAARSMLEHGVGSLPVVADGKLTGIITRSDLLRALTGS